MKVQAVTTPISIGLIVKTTSIKTPQGFISKPVLGAYTKWENKEKVKEWAIANGGGWHPAEKFWWVPLNPTDAPKQIAQTIKVLGYAIAHMGDEVLVSINHKGAKTLNKIFEGKEISVFEQEQVTPYIEKVFESDHKKVSRIGDYFGKEINPKTSELENYQLQGYLMTNIGTSQKVILYERKPQDWLGTEPRPFFGYWAMPWSNPSNEWDLPFWEDEDWDEESQSIKKIM